MKKLISCFCLLMVLFTPVFGQEKVSVSAGADLVSSYIWLGVSQNQGAAIQPRASLSYAGFTLGAWGSTSFDASGAKEVDLYLSYNIKGLTLKVTNYWWAGEAVEYFGTSTHFYEGSIAYNFGEKFPLTLSANTMFAGDKDADGKEQYSTFISASYDFSVCDFGLTPRITITPADGMYASEDESRVLEAAVRVSRSIKLSDSFSLPIFTDLICSPAKKDTYLVFGLSVGI